MNQNNKNNYFKVNDYLQIKTFGYDVKLNKGQNKGRNRRIISSHEHNKS